MKLVNSFEVTLLIGLDTKLKISIRILILSVFFTYKPGSLSYDVSAHVVSNISIVLDIDPKDIL